MTGLSHAGALHYAATRLEYAGEGGTANAVILLRQIADDAPDSYPNAAGERATYLDMTPTQVYEKLLASMNCQIRASAPGKALNAAFPAELGGLTDRCARNLASIVWGWMDELREECGK